MDSVWHIWEAYLAPLIAYLWPALVAALWSVVLLVVLLVGVAFLILFDRKVWAAVQMRRGLGGNGDERQEQDGEQVAMHAGK